jgi:hypothetical protein
MKEIGEKKMNERERQMKEKDEKRFVKKAFFAPLPLPQRGLYLLFWPSKQLFHSVRVLKRPLHSWRKAIRPTYISTIKISKQLTDQKKLYHWKDE